MTGSLVTPCYPENKEMQGVATVASGSTSGSYCKSGPYDPSWDTCAGQGPSCPLPHSTASQTSCPIPHSDSTTDELSPPLPHSIASQTSCPLPHSDSITDELSPPLPHSTAQASCPLPHSTAQMSCPLPYPTASQMRKSMRPSNSLGVLGGGGSVDRVVSL